MLVSFCLLCVEWQSALHVLLIEAALMPFNSVILTATLIGLICIGSTLSMNHCAKVKTC